MKQSKYNFPIKLGKNRVLIVNTLTGAMDIFQESELKYLYKQPEKIEKELKEYLGSRLYLVGDVDETIAAKRLFQGLLNNRRDIAPLKAVLILTFDCNLKCTYCWQQSNSEIRFREKMDIQKIDGIFNAIEEINTISLLQNSGFEKYYRHGYLRRWSCFWLL